MSSQIPPYSYKGLIQPYQNVPQVSFQFWAKPVLKAQDGSYYCPGFEGATYASNAYDFVYFSSPGSPGSFPGTVQPLTPGICEVQVTKARDVDKKKPAGSDGARLTIHGVDPADVEIRLTIWTPEQLRQLMLLWTTLFPKAGKGSPPAFDSSHPTLAFHDVKSLQFVRATGPTIDAQRRGHFVLHAVEFRPPSKKNATKTETESKGSLLDPAPYPTPGANSKNSAP